MTLPGVPMPVLWEAQLRARAARLDLASPPAARGRGTAKGALLGVLGMGEGFTGGLGWLF